MATGVERVVKRFDANSVDNEDCNRMFLNPIFLIGLATAAIPLIIHLSRSRQTKKVRLSTTRFLTDNFVRSYRMSRLKELMLLAARMALCALFALALAQPFLKSDGSALLESTERRTVVFVLDNSASMSYRENDRSLLDRAREAALKVLDELEEGDVASIVVCGRTASGPEAIFDEPVPDLGDVRQAIESTQTTGLGTDLSGAVARAEQIVASGPSDASREIYIFSDLQDSGWELREESVPAELAAECSYVFVSVRPEQPQNLAVTAVQYAASRPVVGVPFEIRPHIRNGGDGSVPCDVELFIDGKKVGEQHLDGIAAGRWSVPVFHHRFDSGGWHSGYVQVQDATLDADNRRHFAVEVVGSIRILAVNGAPSAVRRADELFFLDAALRAGSTEASAVDMDVVVGERLGDTELDPYQIVVLANVGQLTAKAVEQLEAYVDGGRNLLVFSGDRTSIRFHNQSLVGSNRMHGGLLPGPLTGIVGDASSDEPRAGVGEVDSNHVVLASFETDDDPGAPNLLSSVTLKAWHGIDPGDSRVLMRTTTGEPLLCERDFGRGRVMWFGSTCDHDWTNFPARPAFLPWLYRLIAYLAQEPLGENNVFPTGEHVVLPVSGLDGLPQLLVRKPDGTVSHARPGEHGAGSLSFAETDQAGVYTVYPADDEDQSRLFVANLEAWESDLTYLDDVLAESAAEDDESLSRVDRIQQGMKETLLPGRPFVSFVAQPADVSELSAGVGRGLRLWDWFLMLALAVALVEPWFANQISLRHYLKQPEAN
jgi:hypothetical protein